MKMLSFKSFLVEDMIKYKQLQHNDLTKRGGDRVQIFLDKIKSGEEFVTSKGLVTINKAEYDRLSVEMPSRGYSTSIKTSKGMLQYPRDFFKSAEFGGKGLGAGTKAEDIHLSRFQKELARVLELEQQPYIKLRIGKRTVECAGVISTVQKGRYAPKSDFSIVDTKGEDVAWISHKDGRTGKDFQQYGGITDNIMTSRPDVRQFIKDVQAMFPAGMTSGTTVHREIKDRKTIQLAVYGLEYGSSRGIDNVDEFHQGQMRLVKSGGVYTIKSNHKGLNGDIPTGSHKAYLVARYTSNVRYNDIQNARTGVFPEGKVPGTSKEI